MGALRLTGPGLAQQSGNKLEAILFREAWFSSDKVQISGHPHARRRDSWREARVGHCCPAIDLPGLVSAARPQEEHHCHEQVDQVGRERSPGQSMGSSERSSSFFLMKVFVPKIIWLLIDCKEKIRVPARTGCHARRRTVLSYRVSCISG
jgi:hypothetical protein